MENKYSAHIILLTVLVAAFGFSASALGAEKPWLARATLAYQGTAAPNARTDALTAEGDSEYTYRKFVFDQMGDYTFVALNSKTGAENIGGFVGTKFFFTGGDKLYARYHGRWRRNTFAGFEHRVMNFGGLGVYLVRNESQILAVGNLYGYFHEVFTEAAGGRSVGFPATCFGADYRANFNGAYQIVFSATWNISLEDIHERLLTANASLGVATTDWLSITVTERFEWDNVTPEDYAAHDVTTTLGLTVGNYSGLVF